MPLRSRDALLARLSATPAWDIVIIGGGATGLGCAVDAAARGHSVLLLEGRDFAAWRSLHGDLPTGLAKERMGSLSAGITT